MFDGANFIGEAATVDSSYRMVDLKSFPGVILGGEKDIAGEVWEVTDDLFKTLDLIEGYPNFYNRLEVETTLGKAWMYYLSSNEYQDNFEVISESSVLSWNNQTA